MGVGHVGSGFIGKPLSATAVTRAASGTAAGGNLRRVMGASLGQSTMRVNENVADWTRDMGYTRAHSSFQTERVLGHLSANGCRIMTVALYT